MFFDISSQKLLLIKTDILCLQDSEMRNDESFKVIFLVVK